MCIRWHLRYHLTEQFGVLETPRFRGSHGSKLALLWPGHSCVSSWCLGGKASHVSCLPISRATENPGTRCPYVQPMQSLEFRGLVPGSSLDMPRSRRSRTCRDYANTSRPPLLNVLWKRIVPEASGWIFCRSHCQMFASMETCLFDLF